MNEIEQLIQAAPPVVLSVFLTALGWTIKRSAIPNWLIPWILPVAGAALYPLIADKANLAVAENAAIAYNAMIGFVAGAGATGLNQAIRQWQGRNDNGVGGQDGVSQPKPPA